MRRNLNEMMIAVVDCIRSNPNIIKLRICNITNINGTSIVPILEYLTNQKLIDPVEPTNNRRGRSINSKIYKKTTYTINDNGRKVLQLYHEFIVALGGNVETTLPSPFIPKQQPIAQKVGGDTVAT